VLRKGERRTDAAAGELEPYAEDAPVYWVQEEPHNMGAWRFLRVRLGEWLHGRPLRGITRPEAASPGTGSPSTHEREQAQLIERALGDDPDHE
jgi:2-oxoglutarate dehydrogenase E1 component